MDDELLLPKDFSKTTDALKKIEDIWRDNVVAMRNEQEAVLNLVRDLRERHKRNQHTINELRDENSSLHKELDQTKQSKDKMANSLNDANKNLYMLEEKFSEVNDQLRATVAEVRSLEDQLKKATSEAESNRLENTRLRSDLRKTEEEHDKLMVQLAREREEWDLALHEQERSARIRMEDQKKEIEQRLLEKHKSDLLKHSERYRQLKEDFQQKMERSNHEVKELEISRDHWAAEAQRLHDEMDEFRAQTRLEIQQEAAKKFFEMTSALDKPSEKSKLPSILLSRPQNYAAQVLREFRKDSSEMNGDEEDNDELENRRPVLIRSPVRKLPKRSSPPRIQPKAAALERRRSTTMPGTGATTARSAANTMPPGPSSQINHRRRK